MERIEFIEANPIGFLWGFKEEFKKNLNHLKNINQIEIVNEGIFSCEDFLFWLWVQDNDVLYSIYRAENHEGAWVFTIKKNSDAYLKIKKTFKYQGLDCQLEIKLV